MFDDAPQPLGGRGAVLVVARIGERPGGPTGGRLLGRAVQHDDVAGAKVADAGKCGVGGGKAARVQGPAERIPGHWVSMAARCFQKRDIRSEELQPALFGPIAGQRSGGIAKDLRPAALGPHPHITAPPGVEQRGEAMAR